VKLPTQPWSARVRARRLMVVLAALTGTLIGPATQSAAAQKPVNGRLPEVVGAAAVGERLICDSGSWSNVSNFRFEWLRNAIPVGSGPVYFVTSADEGDSLWCVVTAFGSEGSTEAESANSVSIPGGKVESPPVSIEPPLLSGRPAVGETLSCSTGSWSGSPAPVFTYQWVRDVGPGETPIESATASAYKVASADAGHSLACRVTATNGRGTASELSAGVSVPGLKPENTVKPVVLGVEPSAVGEELTCSEGTWSGSPAPTFSYHWVRDQGLPDETVIESAKGRYYTVATADQLHSLSCKVIATNSAGASEALSSNSISVVGSRPQDIAAPSISGISEIGDTLTCEHGTWAGVPTPTYSYIWVRDQGTLGEATIGSATSETYIARFEDRGHSLTCDVTATNSEGSASQASNSVVIPLHGGGSVPANLVAPTVSGEPSLGSTLSCSEGTWSGSPAPTLTYQWLRDGSPIASATASRYVVVEGDEGHTLSCEVTAINDEGIASKISSNVPPVEIPGRPPESIEAPQVLGLPAVGQQLTCLHGTWSGQPSPAFTYQWLRGKTSIPAATASGYTVTSEDRGQAISCRVTARNSGGSASAESTNSLQVPGSPPQVTLAPELSGAAAVGATLTCAPGTWNGEPAPTYTYQWLLNGVNIPSATSNTYVVGPADRGLSLACQVTASNHEGTQQAISKGLHIPGSRPEDIEAPALSGTPAAGQQLTCARGIWKGQPPPAFAYEWLRDGQSISSATSNTYVVQLADQGHLLSCLVTATNGEGRGEAESNAVAIRTPTVVRPAELTFPATPSAAQILHTLHVQIARVQHRVRIASLRKTGLYAFSFVAPAAGQLEVLWYQAPTGGHYPTNAKPLVLAQVIAPFSSAGAKTVKLRLTSVGRRVLGQSSRIPLTVKAVFVLPRAPAVTWIETVLLSH
jgi:hypothetical protein